MPVTNVRSHRTEHRQAAVAVRDLAADDGRKATGEDYRRFRRAIAACRRAEQDTARFLAGIDRASCRARRLPTR